MGIVEFNFAIIRAYSLIALFLPLAFSDLWKYPDSSKAIFTIPKTLSNAKYWQEEERYSLIEVGLSLQKSPVVSRHANAYFSHLKAGLPFAVIGGIGFFYGFNKQRDRIRENWFDANDALISSSLVSVGCGLSIISVGKWHIKTGLAQHNSMLSVQSLAENHPNLILEVSNNKKEPNLLLSMMGYASGALLISGLFWVGSLN